MAQEQAEISLSLSQVAYMRLRDEILSGVFAPDMPLRLEFLKERYGISFSPLREALNQLQVERLVTASSKRGFRVASVSLEEMWDAINTRILIETEALRQSIQHGDDHWEGHVVSSFHALDKGRQRLSDSTQLDPATIETLEERHQHFHTTLISGCPSKFLLQLSATLYAQTERYRRPLLSTAHARDYSTMGPDNEHRAMMAAALARDEKAAVDLLKHHLTGTGHFIEQRQAERNTASATNGASEFQIN